MGYIPVVFPGGRIFHLVSFRKITSLGGTKPPTLITAITKEVQIKGQIPLNKGGNLI